MKKTAYKICTVVGMMSLVFLAESCLKDDRYVDFGAVENTVIFPKAIPGKASAISFDDPTSPDPIHVQVLVHQTGPNATDKDLTVSLGFSQEAIDLYNTDHSHVEGTALPTDAYSYPATVVIKAGKDSLNNNNRSVAVDLLIYPNKVPITPGVNYVLSLHITGVSPTTVVGSNFSSILFNFYHNPYDGSYHAEGTRYNYNAQGDYPGDFPPTGYTGTIPWEFDTEVLTVNATTSIIHVGQVDGGLGYMYMIVDPDTNEITLQDIADGTFATGVDTLVPALPGSAGVTSEYIPGTNTIELYYGWENTTTTGAFRVIHETLVHN